MNPEKALLMYALLEMMSETMSDDRASKILDWVEGLVGKLRESRTYARVIEDIDSGLCLKVLHEIELAARKIERIETWEAEGRAGDRVGIGGLDHETLIWVLSMNTAARLQDFYTFLAETCFFVAAQERALYRVKDDRRRLSLTYLHLKTLKRLAES